MTNFLRSPRFRATALRPLAITGAAAALALPASGTARPLNVVSTTPVPAALAEAVGGDRVRATSLCKGFQDPHVLEAKPSYMVQLHRADLLLAIGLDLEIGYLPLLAAGSRNPKIQGGRGFLDLSTVITPKDVTDVADRRQGDVHPSGNPHYWLDPENARAMARAIAAALAALDPDGRPVFETNLAAWETALDRHQADWATRMAPLGGRKIVTFHKSWTYFAERYGLRVVGYVEPKPGIPPSPSHTLDLVRQMKAEGATSIVMENFYDRRAADAVAKRVGGTVVVVPNNVGGEGPVKTYFDLIETIVSRFEKSL